MTPIASDCTSFVEVEIGDALPKAVCAFVDRVLLRPEQPTESTLTQFMVPKPDSIEDQEALFDSAGAMD